MTAIRFHDELEQLERDVVATAAATREIVARAVDAVLGDEETDVASAGVAGGGVETRAYALIARNQPTAGDLRAVMTAIRVLRELERVDRLARHVARASSRVPRHELTPRTRGLLTRLAQASRDVFARSVDAYADRDAISAGALQLLDDEVDDLHRQLLTELFAARLDTAPTVQLALLARYLERIGDHAVTIGGRVAYLVTGELASG